MFGGSEFQRSVDVPRTFVVLSSVFNTAECQMMIDRWGIVHDKTHEDIRTDLANVFGETITVEVIVLNLEILSKGDENGQGEFVGVLIGDSTLWSVMPHSVIPIAGDTTAGDQTYHSHGESDRKVKGVESSLVNDNEVVSSMSLFSSLNHINKLTFRGRIWKDQHGLQEQSTSRSIAPFQSGTSSMCQLLSRQILASHIPPPQVRV